LLSLIGLIKVARKAAYFTVEVILK
jgi:hypothetical protein